MTPEEVKAADEWDKQMSALCEPLNYATEETEISQETSDHRYFRIYLEHKMGEAPEAALAGAKERIEKAEMPEGHRLFQITCRWLNVQCPDENPLRQNGLIFLRFVATRITP